MGENGDLSPRLVGRELEFICSRHGWRLTGVNAQAWVRAFSLPQRRGEGGRRPDEAWGHLRRRTEPLTPALSPPPRKGEGERECALGVRRCGSAGVRECAEIFSPVGITRLMTAKRFRRVKVFLGNLCSSPASRRHTSPPGHQDPVRILHRVAGAVFPLSRRRARGGIAPEAR